MSDTEDVVGDLQAGVTDEDDPTSVPEGQEPEDADLGADLFEEEEPEPVKAEPTKTADAVSTEQWDRDRQERDQRHAASTKELEAKIGGLSVQLNASNAKLALLEQGRKDTADKTPSANPPLDEDADIDDIVAHLNKQTAEQASERDALSKELASLKSELKKRDERSEKIAAEAALKEIVGGMETKFGQKYSAEAQKRAQDYLRDKGYDEDNGPDDVAMELALERFFREVRDEDSRRDSKPKKTTTVPLDTGTGGSSTQEPRRPMTNAQFKANMRRKGVNL